ncbi:MAG: protein BatD [Deltaproteobacteria bacterium]|nr:protein BatD [Deltaproteobacteria bacterium]
MLSQSVRAEDVSYVVTPEARQVAVGQSFQVVCDISTSGGDIEALTLPDTDAFRLVGQSRSEGSQVSIVNGQLSVSRTVRVTLTLQAEQIGQLTIGPGQVHVKGKVVRSAPVTITVVDGGGKAATGAPSAAAPAVSGAAVPVAPPGKQFDKLFAALSVDQGTVYLGQQITATLTLYSRADLSDIRTVRLPDFEGVVVQELEVPRRVTALPIVLGGRRYQSFMLRKIALFPTRAGDLVLPPANVTAVVGGGFFSSGQLIKLDTEPVDVQVLPLPVTGRPDGFEPGNVGTYTLEVIANRTRISQRDPLTLQVAVIGVGNFKAVTPPALETVDGFRLYQPTPFEESRVEDGVIRGRKGYEILLQPQRAGRLTVPGLRFSYFDPQQNSYRTVASAPIAIEIEAATGGVAPATAPALAASQSALPARPVRLGLSPAPAPEPLSMSAFAAIAGGGQVALLVVLGLGRWRNRRAQTVRHRRRLERAAARRAAVAASAGNDAHALARAVEVFLELALNLPITGLTRDQLADALRERGLGDALVSSVLAFFDAAEAARFAPPALRGNTDLAALSGALLDVVERAADAEEVA